MWYVHGRNLATNKEEVYGIFENYGDAIELLILLLFFRYHLDEQLLICFRRKIIYLPKKKNENMEERK